VCVIVIKQISASAKTAHTQSSSSPKQLIPFPQQIISKTAHTLPTTAHPQNSSAANGRREIVVAKTAPKYSAPNILPPAYSTHLKQQ